MVSDYLLTDNFACDLKFFVILDLNFVSAGIFEVVLFLYCDFFVLGTINVFKWEIVYIIISGLNT